MRQGHPYQSCPQACAHKAFT
ncbi:hypothetical protein Nmel_013794 [Mimus melanotis]